MNVKSKDTMNSLADELRSHVTNQILKGLLGVMCKVFALSSKGTLKRYGPLKGLSKNIEGFNGRYLFGTFDGTHVGVVFKDDVMSVFDEEIPDWDIKVMFKSDAVLLDFLLFGKMDILKPLLHNHVEVEGNMNYLAKFGFMARDLLNRCGLL